MYCVQLQGNTFYGSLLAARMFSLKMENTRHWQNMNYVSTLILLNISSNLTQVTETECMHTDTCISEISINDNGMCRITENTFSAQWPILIFDKKPYMCILSTQQGPVLGAFEKLQKKPLASSHLLSICLSVCVFVCLSVSVRPSVRPPASNNSPPTGQIFMKFSFEYFSKLCGENNMLL